MQASWELGLRDLSDPVARSPLGGGSGGFGVRDPELQGLCPALGPIQGPLNWVWASGPWRAEGLQGVRRGNSYLQVSPRLPPSAGRAVLTQPLSLLRPRASSLRWPLPASLHLHRALPSPVAPSAAPAPEERVRLWATTAVMRPEPHQLQEQGLQFALGDWGRGGGTLASVWGPRMEPRSGAEGVSAEPGCRGGGAGSPSQLEPRCGC